MNGEPTEESGGWLETLVATIPGAHVRDSSLTDRPGTLLLAVDETLTVETAQELVALVGETRQLWFYDGDHPRVSDPGLYVTLQRSGEHVWAKGANHGWSYPWTPLDDDAAAHWLFVSRGWNTGTGPAEQQTMRFATAPPLPDRDRPTAGAADSTERFRTWLAGRLGRPLLRLTP